MLYGINSGNNDITNGLIGKDSSIEQLTNAKRGYATSPFKNTHFIDESQISDKALSLYQRELDIKKFASLALSNEDDNSHLDLIEELFNKKGVKSPFTDDFLSMLTDNQKLLEDIDG